MYSIRAILHDVPRVCKLQRMASGWVSLSGSECARDFSFTDKRAHIFQILPMYQ